MDKKQPVLITLDTATLQKIINQAYELGFLGGQGTTHMTKEQQDALKKDRKDVLFSDILMEALKGNN